MSPRPQAWGHGETSVVAAESEVEICDSSGSPGAPTQCVHRRDTGSLPAQGAGTPRAPGNGPIGSRFAPARVRDAQWWSSFRENEVSILRARVVNWERVLSSFSCLRLSVAGGFPGPRPLLTDSPPSPGAASGPPASLHPLRPSSTPSDGDREAVLTAALRVALKGMAPIASMSLAGPERLSQAWAAWCTRVLNQPVPGTSS